MGFRINKIECCSALGSHPRHVLDSPDAILPESSVSLSVGSTADDANPGAATSLSGRLHTQRCLGPRVACRPDRRRLGPSLHLCLPTLSRTCLVTPPACDASLPCRYRTR
eukprot:scaffold792_cov60-Phaeocystis_antarctica.AAC.6